MQSSGAESSGGGFLFTSFLPRATNVRAGPHRRLVFEQAELLFLVGLPFGRGQDHIAASRTRGSGRGLPTLRVTVSGPVISSPQSSSADLTMFVIAEVDGGQEVDLGLGPGFRMHGRWHEHKLEKLKF